MSIEYTPVQSFAGNDVPPEETTAVRRMGALTHNVPPWNGDAFRPVVP
jgi:hypothetical protein